MTMNLIEKIRRVRMMARKVEMTLRPLRIPGMMAKLKMVSQEPIRDMVSRAVIMDWEGSWEALSCSTRRERICWKEALKSMLSWSFSSSEATAEFLVVDLTNFEEM